MRRTSIIIGACVFIGLFSNCKTDDKSTTEILPKPNIIYVLADQWRAQATGYNGDPNLIGKTPNLDRIADQGINFKNAVSVTPVCTPYRAALLTGQYPTTTGMIFNDIQLPAESVTMAELFKKSGYKTSYIGKWHLDGMGRDQYTPQERRQGFDYWKALECSHEYQELYYYEGDDKEKKLWEGYGPYAETKDAKSYIKSNANNTDPFLMVLAWGAPHFPYHNTPDEMQVQFNQEDIILSGNVAEELKEAAAKQSTGYYAHILALDKCLGEIQTAIEEAGISKNTIFVFTSDHGEMMGSQGVRPRQKQVPWAESAKVPFLIRYPARYGNEKIVVDAPINTPDILPTLLSMAGLSVPSFIEGESMAEAIEKPELAMDKAALVINVSPFAGMGDEYRGIYTERYAYIKTLNGPWLLFDNTKDSLQMNNLVGNPEYETLQRQMEQKLQRELEKVNDNFEPRQFYIDKWEYKLTDRGHIPYYSVQGEDSDKIVFQGPALNKK